MCFSATASFTASGVLLLTGAACVSKVSKPQQLPLALTPLFFSIQQFSEGILWVFYEMPDAELIQKISSYVFVMFGQSFWPVWIPIYVLALEKDEARKKILKVMLILGIMISAVLMYYTMMNGVTPVNEGHHFKYIFTYPALIDRLSLVYLIPTVISNFVSGHNKIKILGALTLIAFVISKISFDTYVFSVWCYFAAIISIFIYFNMDNILQPKVSYNQPG